MSFISKVILLAIVCFAQIQAQGDQDIAVPLPSDGMIDLQRLLRPAINHNKLSALHMRPVSVLDVLYKSRWRNSINNVIRLLVVSTNADERKVGWELARERGYPMGWTASDIDKIVKDPIDEVRTTAIASVARTDVPRITQCIEQILKDPSATTGSKTVCIWQLRHVPELSDRVRFWLMASSDNKLREACVSEFETVNFSEPVIQVMTSYLDDRSPVHLDVAPYWGRPTELRTCACQVLSTIGSNKDRIVEELRKRCDLPPARKHLEFFIGAMLAIHKLSPESSEPVVQIMKWYDKLPDDRLLLLQSVENEFSDSGPLEILVISKIQETPPDQKYRVCRWLSCRKSSAAILALKKLLQDTHSGVRVAAAVAITKIDPLFELSTIREDLFKSAAESPDEFMAAFESMSDAVVALAHAGQSDEDAIRWLKLNRDRKFQVYCDEALEVLSVENPTYTRGGIRWKEAITGYK
ncbi:MAG: hypothetical protein V4719_09435 [Planctomycetota bacterium]